MKIAKIEAIPVSYPEPNDFNALRHLCLAKITADDGQIGWGESITQFPEANAQHLVSLSLFLLTAGVLLTIILIVAF